VEPKLGKINKVDLKIIWNKEDKDFTPWLNNNIELLADRLGVEIIDTQTEEKVGNFYLDIYWERC